MPAYAAKQLLWYEHPHPTKPHYYPYNPNPIKYGQDNQATDLINPSPKLDKGKSIPPPSWHYLLLLANKLHLLKTRPTAYTSSLVKWPFIPMPKYNIQCALQCLIPQCS